MKKNYKWGTRVSHITLTNLFRIMKLYVLLTLLTILQINAAISYSQSARVSLHIKDGKFEDVFNDIERQSEFEFLYNDQQLDAGQLVNIDADNVTISDLLDRILVNKSISYQVIDKRIVLVQRNSFENKLLTMIQSQQTRISGQVTDATTGEPLPGVNILIKNTLQGVITDMNGKYTIEVKEDNPVLVYSFVGYISQEIAVSGRSVIDVVLSSDVKTLDEVVVIGYGTQKKVDVTGAVSTVRISDMQKIHANNASVALQGQASGVNIVQTNADPGAGADIRIRGIGTLNNHFPLVIVDGVPSEINAVDPKDIESVNILKDAASAAIYGSRAANGVVIINTKRGAGISSQKTKVDYHGYFSFNSREKDFGLINNSADYIKVAKMAAENSGSEYPLFVTQWEANPNQFGNTDWENEIFRNSTEQKHDLSISRSGENYNFYVSTGYRDEQGIRLGSEDKQYSLRINSDFQISKRLRIGESIGYTQNKGMYYPNTYFFWQLVMTNPLQKIYDPTTSSGYAPELRDVGFKESQNPVRDYTINESTYKNDNMLVSAYLEFEPVKNLKYLFRISQNYARNTNFSFKPTYYSDFYDQNKENDLSESYGNTMHNIMDNILSYSIDISKHSISALVGYSWEDNKYHWFSGAGKVTPSNSIRNLGATTKDQSTDGGDEQNRLLSMFGRLSYTYANKYIFQANVRRDGSSRFAPENRWGWFPSASLGWRVSEESFFESIKPAINELKLRASYGTLGMQEVGNYTYIPTILTDDSGLTNYPFGIGPSQPIFVGGRQVSFPSVGLKWETTKSTNIGFDMAMLNNRLTLEADYYMKDVSDILFAVPIPLSTGSSTSPPVNSASIKNKGFEFTAGWREFEGKFKYDLRMTFAHNTNEVIELGDVGNNAITGGSVYWALNDVTRTEVGTQLGEFYVFKTAGLFQNQAEIDAYQGSKGIIMPDAKPGDLKIVDTDKNGSIDNNDKVFMGSGLPKAELGLTFNASYLNFDLNLFIYSSLGLKKYNGGRWMASMAEEYHGWHKDMLNAWTPQNTHTDIPRLVNDASHFNVRESDLYVENASYLRISHLELGYNLPTTPLNKIKIAGARIYLGGENLLTLTKYKGWDPGIGGGGDSYASGIDRYPYPVARKVMFGLQVTF
jgi:TonB-dependent starch-binding outer membrane protein SusC